MKNFISRKIICAIEFSPLYTVYFKDGSLQTYVRKKDCTNLRKAGRNIRDGKSRDVFYTDRITTMSPEKNNNLFAWLVRSDTFSSVTYHLKPYVRRNYGVCYVILRLYNIYVALTIKGGKPLRCTNTLSYVTSITLSATV